MGFWTRWCEARQRENAARSGVPWPAAMTDARWEELFFEPHRLADLREEQARYYAEVKRALRARWNLFVRDFRNLLVGWLVTVLFALAAPLLVGIVVAFGFLLVATGVVIAFSYRIGERRLVESQKMTMCLVQRCMDDPDYHQECIAAWHQGPPAG